MVWSALLEEFKTMRGEIDASIGESDRWLKFALSFAAAFIAGGLTAASVFPTAVPPLMLVGSAYLTFAAVMYFRGAPPSSCWRR